MSATTFLVSPVPQEADPSYSLLDPDHPIPDLVSGPIALNILTCSQRIGLVKGPTASIYLGTKYIGFVNIRAAMALSPFAHTFFHQHPNHGMKFPTAAVDEKAMQTVLRYFSYHFLGGTTVLRLPIGKSFIESIAVYHAALTFRLEKHIPRLVGFLHGYIKREDSLLSYDEFDALLSGTTAEDRLFRHAASLYAKLRFTNDIPDPEEFNEWVNTRPVLAEAMAEIDERHAREREFYDRKRKEKMAWLERKKEREGRARKVEERKKKEEEEEEEEEEERIKAEKIEAEKIEAEKIRAEKREAEKARKKAQETRPAPGLTRSLEATERSKAFWAKFN